jgi:hypothetical protein
VCKGPAFFRNKSFNGLRASCFGARSHAEGCPLSAYDNLRAGYGDDDNMAYIPGGTIIVDLNYGSPVRPVGVPATSRASYSDVGEYRSQVRIPRDSATDFTVIRPPSPRSSCRVSRSEATQDFQLMFLSCLLSNFLGSFFSATTS